MGTDHTTCKMWKKVNLFLKKEKKRKKSRTFSVFKIRLCNINQPSGVGNIDEIAYTDGMNGHLFTSLDWCTTSAPGVLVV